MLYGNNFWLVWNENDVSTIDNFSTTISLCISQQEYMIIACACTWNTKFISCLKVAEMCIIWSVKFVCSDYLGFFSLPVWTNYLYRAFSNKWDANFNSILSRSLYKDRAHITADLLSLRQTIHVLEIQYSTVASPFSLHQIHQTKTKKKITPDSKWSTIVATVVKVVA